MTAVEIVLILVGVVFMISSFFVTERLSQKEISHISDLSSQEIKYILEKSLQNAQNQVQEALEAQEEEVLEDSRRGLEKETNLKIQHISEYSDTVMEGIQKNHSEVMFLYSMLGDKHTELVELAERLNKESSQLQQEIQKIEQQLQNMDDQHARIQELSRESQNVRKPLVEDDWESAEAQILGEEVKEPELENPTIEVQELTNSNQDILELHRQGISVREIARRLGLGIGEVKLVVELYRGEEA